MLNNKLAIAYLMLLYIVLKIHFNVAMSFLCLCVHSKVFKILRILSGEKENSITGYVSQMATDFLQPTS